MTEFVDSIPAWRYKARLQTINGYSSSEYGALRYAPASLPRLAPCIRMIRI
ncbi:MAG: hypothetical protein WAS28_02735 [Saprospiraceae bacterium]